MRIDNERAKNPEACLIGVTKCDRAPVAARGFPVLFGSADDVAKRLSTKGQAKILK